MTHSRPGRRSFPPSIPPLARSTALVTCLLMSLAARAGDPPAEATTPSSTGGAQQAEGASEPGVGAEPEVASNAAWLARWGVNSEHFAEVVAGGNSPARDAALAKLLWVTRRMSLALARSWVDPREPGRPLEAPAGQVVWLRGRVTRVSRQNLAAAVAAPAEADHFWRVTLEVAGASDPVEVWALEVPAAWPRERACAEPASCFALALGSMAPTADAATPRPTFLARRMAWHPATSLVAFDPSDPFDQGLLEAVEQRSRFAAADADPFFELLRVAGRGSPEIPRQMGDEPLGVVEPLFNDPSSQVGRWVELTGTARRVVPIAIEGVERQRQAGVPQYFEIEFFTGDSQGSPLVACSAAWPSDLPVGESLSEPIRVAGFFYKVWAFRARGGEPNASGRERLQLAPLLVAARVSRAPNSPTSGGSWELIWPVTLLIAVTAVASLIAWGWSRQASRPRRVRPLPETFDAEQLSGR